MNIIVTGGTGFIGSEIVRRLLKEPGQARISVGTRLPDRYKGKHSNISSVHVDVNDPESLKRAIQGHEVVIHCVQFPNAPVENAHRGWTYAQVDGEGTVRLVKAAQESGVRRVIYLSGAGAGRGRQEPCFKAKALAEEAIASSGMEYVIFRPSWVYGSADRSMNRFARMARFLPFLPVIGDGSTKVYPIFVRDVAEAVVQSVRNLKATNKIFELGGPEELTMDEIMATVLRVLGRRRFLLHHPVWLMKAVAQFLKLLPGPPLTPGAIDFLTMENYVDSAAVVEVFDLRLSSLESSLKSYMSR